MKSNEKYLIRFFKITILLILLLPGCEAPVPEGLMVSKKGSGPVVIFDLYKKPLPEVPLPNDIAARPDPNSPTGMRLNASMIADTELESHIRKRLNDLDGWGTYSPITVSFECEGDRDGICLDIDNIIKRHQKDGYDFKDDAVYLIDIQKKIPDPENPDRMIPNPDFGKPVPLDIGGGNFPIYLDRKGYYYPNDPRRDSPTIMFESENEFRGEDVDCDGRLDANEDLNGNGLLDPGEDLDGDGWLDVDEDKNGNALLDRPDELSSDPAKCVKPDFYDPAFDTNFDGKLGRANVWCRADDYKNGKCHCIEGHECPRGLNPDFPEDMEKLTYFLDPQWHTIYFYEFETNTLIIRPLVPLREKAKYVVVLTDRLVGENNKPVNSPFKYINHVDQTNDLKPLKEILNGSNDEYYGGVKLENVRFAWSFTTQSVIEDLKQIRRGLYGYGKFSYLAQEFPPDAIVNRTWACNPLDKEAGRCNEQTDMPSRNKNHFIIKSDELMKVVTYYAEDVFGLSTQELQPILDTYKYVDYFVFGHFWSPNFLDTDGDGVEEYRSLNEDVDGDGKLEYNEDTNCNGILDEGEDIDGDTELDTSEDENMNLKLDPGEDKDGDGHLDKNEDRNGNCKLDIQQWDEGYWNVNTKTGKANYGKTYVSFLIAVPKQEYKIKGREDKPFPVVFYGHGYTSMYIEALGFAGNLAKFGLATVAINCVHHGIGEDAIDLRTIEAMLQSENLTGLVHGLLDDRTVELNGDGKKESAGDFWTAYIFHTRDMVRQSAIDHYNMIRILRSFDGRRLAGPVDIDGDGVPDEKWDFVNWKNDPRSDYYELVGDFNYDGTIDIAGDFNGDGKVDVGGPDNWYFAWGQSLGGIMSALMGGAEPAIRAIAPTSGGGGLGDIAVRSTQGGVKEAVILRTIGPIVTSRVISEDESGDTSVCRAGDLSLAFTVPDLNDDVNVEFACACFGDTPCPEDDPAYMDSAPEPDNPDSTHPIHLSPGDGITVLNVTKQEAHCALVGKEGQVRVSFPSDLLDRVDIIIYDGSEQIPYKSFDGCETVEGAIQKAYIRTWRRGQSFQFWRWSMARRESDPETFYPVGEPLRSPAEGYGKVKNTAGLRKFLAIAQVGLEPGDPINYAPHYFLSPIRYLEEDQYYPDHRTNAIVIGTVGDMNVPVNTASAQGRAAGIVDFYNTDTVWGKSANQVLVDNYMIEAIERLHRSYPDDASGVCTPDAAGRQGCDKLFDGDDIDRGCDGKQAPYLEVPLRQWVASRRSDWGECVPDGKDPDTGFDRWKCGRCVVFTSTVENPPEQPTRLDACRKGHFIERVTCPGGVSVMLYPYIDTSGTHGFGIPEPCAQFDLNTFMINMIGLYFRSGGTTVSYEMCQQMQAREDAMDPTGKFYMLCPTWDWWTCPACPNRRCDRQWYELNHPPSCPDRWEDIPENEHELLPTYYTTTCE